MDSQVPAHAATTPPRPPPGSRWRRRPAACPQVRTGPLWERVARRIELPGRPLDVPVRVSHDDRVVYIVLKQLAAGFSATPQDAAVTVEDGPAGLTGGSRGGRAPA